MEMRCVVNKKSIRKNRALKTAQKGARKYYQEKLFAKAPNATKAKIRKLADLNEIEYQALEEPYLSSDSVQGTVTKEQLVTLCHESGLIGRSGNGFPVAKKLEAFTKENGTLIINAVECDPGLVTDSWIYRNKRKEIETGAKLVKQALGISQVILATKEPQQSMSGMKQINIIDRFPMGYENYLIKAVLGVELKEQELPQEKGILVMNLQTIVAIAEITRNREAGQYKYITAANLTTGKAKVVRVHIGDSIEETAGQCYTKEELMQNTLYAGGGAFTCHKVIPDETVLDTTGYLAIGQMPEYECAGKCKGCGACTKNCPAGVMVHKLVQYVEKNGTDDIAALKEYLPKKCIGCGTCTYGCMAGKDVREVVMCAKIALS